jgi:hypothetical protein
MREVSDKSDTEGQNISFVWNTFLFPANRVVYEIITKDTVQPDGP